MCANSYQQVCDDWTLEQWQNWFAGIYGGQNQFSTPELIWYRQLEEIGETLKLARMSVLDDLGSSLPDIPAWLFAFCDVMDISLQDAVWAQFRDGCPWCRAKENCTCLYDYPRKVPVTVGPSLFAAHRDAPMGTWITVLDQLYGRVYRRESLLNLVTYLNETAGVVAKALRIRQPKAAISRDIANFFAWTVGLYLRYKSIVQEQRTLPQMIIDKYATCPNCHRRPCICHRIVSSALVGFALPEASDLDLERKILRLVGTKQLEHQFVHRIGGFGDQVRHAQRLDALLLVLSSHLPRNLEALYHVARESGKEVAVFSFGRADDDLLGPFLEQVKLTGRMQHVREDELLQEVEVWIDELNQPEK